MVKRAYAENYNQIDWSRPIKVEAKQQVAPKRSSLSAPGVIHDTMKPVQSMLDGKMYDSKAALRATYKAAGVTEVGDDPSVTTKPKFMEKKKPSKAEVKATVDKAFSQAGLGA